MLESRHSNTNSLSLEKSTPKQQLNIKDTIIDANNRLNEMFPSFNPFSSEFSLGSRLIDIYPSYISFHFITQSNEESRKVHFCKLNEIIFQMLINSNMAVLVSDTSINVTSTEAELFTIRYGINQATQLSNIKYIIIVTDSMHTAKSIFDSLIHLFQIQLSNIFKELRKFFKKKINTILSNFETVLVATTGLFTD